MYTLKEIDSWSPEEIDSLPYPDNVGVGLTHGSGDVHEFYDRLSEDFRRYENRLLKNFFDSATPHMMPKDFPKNQWTIVKCSRALGDPNREKYEKRAKEGDPIKFTESIFPEKDFNGVKIWTPGEELTDAEKWMLLDKFYDAYHESVLNILYQEEVLNPQNPYIFFDLHDTGSLLLKPDPKEDTIRPPYPGFQTKGFPKLCIGTQFTRSCHPDVRGDFADLMQIYLQDPFKIRPVFEKPYAGGYMCETYGVNYNKALPAHARYGRNFIQIEAGRYLVVDEKTQTIHEEKAELFRIAFSRVLKKLGYLYKVKRLLPHYPKW